MKSQVMLRRSAGRIRIPGVIIAVIALMISLMSFTPSATANVTSGPVEVDDQLLNAGQVQVASTIYENPDLAPGVTSVSNDQWKDTKVDCRLITETAAFYTTMTQANSWLDIANVADCDVNSTAPTRSGNVAFYQLSSGQYVELTRRSNGHTLTIWWGSAPVAPRLTLSNSSITGLIGEPIAPITVTPANFTPSLFDVNPVLPAGLSLDPATGGVSGTPTLDQLTADYTITGSDGTQQATAVLSIRILAEPPVTVTFKQDYGMPTRSVAVEQGQSMVLPKTQNASGQEGVTLTGRGSVLFPIVKDYHLFEGWYSDPGFADASFVGLPGDSFTPVASVELHAKWLPARDICFQVRDNTVRDLVTFPADWYPWAWDYPMTPCAGTTRGTQVRVPSGVQFQLPIPTRANAGFHGWYSSQQSTDGSSTSGTLRGRGGAAHQVEFSSGSVLTYHSQWQTQTFRINFDPGSGVSRDSFGSAPCEAVGTSNFCGIRWNSGDSIGSDGRSAVEAPSPTRDGWEFKGWFTSSSGGARLGGGGDLISGAANDTVRAQWTKVSAPATVTFDVGDGAGNPPDPVTTTVGSSIPLPRPTRAQYAFVGWFDQASGGARVGEAGRNYTVTGDVTLHARWLDATVPPRPQTPANPTQPDRGVVIGDDGQPSEVDVRPNPGNTGVSVGRPDANGTPGFEIVLEGVNREGNPVELSPEGLLILSEDRRVAAAGSRFTPDAPVAFYLYPPGAPVLAAAHTRTLNPTTVEPILVGTLTVDATGDFSGTLTLPDGMSSGDYLVQAVGPTASGETLSITLGVRVEGSAAQVTPPPVFPPGPPLNVQGTPGPASVQVTWSPPAQSGSFPISTYQVVGSPTGGCIVQAPAQSCVVTELSQATSYTFTVRALNGAGWGPYSTPSTPVTPGESARTDPTIMITGSRGEVRGRNGIQLTGITTGLAGQVVLPRVKLAGETTYRTGIGKRTVSQDERFTWQRITNKRIYVYFKSGDIRSKRIILANAG